MCSFKFRQGRSYRSDMRNGLGWSSSRPRGLDCPRAHLCLRVASRFRSLVPLRRSPVEKVCSADMVKEGSAEILELVDLRYEPLVVVS